MDGGPRVLVVDDDESLLEVARLLLEEEGYAVEVASSGATALARMRSEPRPALVLLDLMMPAIGGRAVLREMERDADLAGIQVVVMTAAGINAETSALRYPLLRKPFDLDDLVRTMAAYCPRLWDEDEPATDEDARVVPEGLESTSRVACSACGERASSRCAGCGEAFCKGCLDAGPDGRCARCWRDAHR